MIGQPVEVQDKSGTEFSIRARRLCTGSSSFDHRAIHVISRAAGRVQGLSHRRWTPDRRSSLPLSARRKLSVWCPGGVELAAAYTPSRLLYGTAPS